MNDPDAKIPALVVSGFLGSGKTSLVRHLLEQARAEGIRIAVVSNELGALGIDRALLGAGGEAFVELEGGCVCCELADDLLETLELLHDRVSPDRVVISAAADSRHGHPHAEAVDDYVEAAGFSHVYCTNRHGTIRVYGYPNGRVRVNKQRQSNDSCTFDGGD